MALPSITMPASLPAWLAAGYSNTEESLYATAPMSTGSARVRRRWTVSSRRVTASLALKPEALVDFHQWHEGTLEAGRLAFSAQFAQLSPSRAWFETLLIGYESTPMPGGLTMVSCDLLLRGEPSMTGPA